MSFDALTLGRLRGFTAKERALLILSIIGSLNYFLTQRWHMFPASVILKALGMAPLALIAFRLWSAEGKTDPACRDLVILGLALSFSCLGDIFLDLGSSRFFIHGLSSFLGAHLIYIVLFYRSWKRPLRPSFSQLSAPRARCAASNRARIPASGACSRSSNSPTVSSSRRSATRATSTSSNRSLRNCCAF